MTDQTTPTPAPSDCDSPSSDELVVVGRSCGQQNSDGSYNGHVTVLAVGGQELLGENSTSSGTTETGSLAPVLGPILPQLNSGLAQLCSSSSNNICLSLLDASSSTTSSGSTNRFSAASADVGGSSGIQASALSSSGDISQTSTCQTASGSSSVADLSAGGTHVANVANSSDSSTACQGGSSSQSHSSQVLGGAISQLTSPIIGADCANGSFEQVLSQLPPQLAAIYCNAFDSNGAQASAPYGTSEGLTATILGALAGTPLPIGPLGLAAPESESLAMAPPSISPSTSSSSSPSTFPSSSPSSSPGGSPTVLTSAESSPSSTPSSGQLAFTGLNLALELLVSLALLGAGAAVWFASRRRVA